MGKNKTGAEEFFGGLAFIVVLGAVWFVVSGASIGGIVSSGMWWLVFPVLFAGVFPMVKGLRRMISAAVVGKERRRLELENRDGRAERTALRVASKNGGIVTPALIALESDLGLEEADKILQNLAGRGYAEMRVRENGTIEYSFPEFADISRKLI